MKDVIANLQSDLLQAMGIWALLVLTGLSALLLLKSKVYQAESATRFPKLKPDPVRDRLHAQHTDELIRYAREVTVAAGRAEEMALRRREEWLAAQAQLDEAWEAYQASDIEAQRFIRAAALPTPEADRTPAEYAFRERFLHRAAMAACSHKLLSSLDLSDALAHRKGWDPKLHPAEQEVVLRRAVRDGMWNSYRAASQRERTAWQSADVANEARVSLREEARMALARASQAAAGKPLALAGDAMMILPRVKRPDRQFSPDRRRLVSDTMVLPTLG
jgi:hypothetical protein